ncbi:MAG: peptidylprolyl isomerase [Bacteroidota bacterium]|nr:peptidylprolyl isomerase [Bacteroidota bacterium]MDP4230333.1 peptidylprolyl isomerase [Bacteroidota bacterium]MDP4235232.1 peptidylprolyl isomerase [Bacteroidota bacterium]
MKKIFSRGCLFLLLLANVHCASGPKTMGAPYAGAVLDKYCSDPHRLLVIDTKQGTMKIQLFDKVAPHHVAQIMKLVQDGKYDGTTFHRVKAGSLIQGGDPNSKDDDLSNDGLGGMGDRLNAEFNDGEFFRGVCGMALGSDVNSASSQFFICVKDHSDWDHHYTVWGQVIEGYATLDSIASLAATGKYPKASDGSVNPGKDAVMTKLYIEEQK